MAKTVNPYPELGAPLAYVVRVTGKRKTGTAHTVRLEACDSRASALSTAWWWQDHFRKSDYAFGMVEVFEVSVSSTVERLHYPE